VVALEVPGILGGRRAVRRLDGGMTMGSATRRDQEQLTIDDTTGSDPSDKDNAERRKNAPLVVVVITTVTLVASLWYGELAWRSWMESKFVLFGLRSAMAVGVFGFGLAYVLRVVNVLSSKVAMTVIKLCVCVYIVAAICVTVIKVINVVLP
jgi:hypothetical protein